MALAVESGEELVWARSAMISPPEPVSKEPLRPLLASRFESSPSAATSTPRCRSGVGEPRWDATQLLARRPNVHGFVFPSPRSDSVWNSDNFRADAFAKAVKRAAAKAQPARRADFERLEFHDLRHTFAGAVSVSRAVLARAQTSSIERRTVRRGP
jgi:hypothetical protein